MQHSEPHFGPEGGCNCICDECMIEVTDKKLWNVFNYHCSCSGCSGKCDDPEAPIHKGLL